jgi:transposase
MKMIMAIDLGKFKSVACLYDKANGDHEFVTLATKPAQVHDLLIEHEPDLVVIEACGISSWVVDLVESLDMKIVVANTNDQRWQKRHIKRKTDRDDALKLARLAAMNELPEVHVPAREVREKRSLINYRKRLSDRVTQIKNTIRSILERQALSLPAGKNGWSKKCLAQLRAWSRPLADTSKDQLWRGELAMELALLETADDALRTVEDKLAALNAKDKQVRQLQKIEGVGPRLAEAVAAYIDDPHRFETGKQVGCYFGMTPRQYQSGQMDRHGRISKQGNGLVRSLLVEVCWLAMQWNPWIKQTYERLVRGSKTRKKIAIVAVARRLLIRMWAMLRDGTRWRMPALSPMV